MTLKVTLDRIEGDFAVLLIRPDEIHEISWPSSYLPHGVREGSILTIHMDVDAQETQAADTRVRSLLEKLQDKQRCVEDTK
ncbi:MAG: DUF3006 domain-containing protein [Firmicutes bacterium]|jgi:hypothetical protein|nr:DUF3006 domain-containing protein [Bacillota bacterium]HXL05086.1 DUF3006 domain-containing protein [Bacillota bacterium]